MPRFLALDADGAGAAVLAVSVTKGRVSVERAFTLPVDPAAPPLGAGAAAFGTVLRDALKAAGVKPAPLLMVVGRDQVVIKEVKHPASAPADEPAVVKFQAVRDLADAADDVVMDYRPLGAAADGDRKAQVLFVRKPVVAGARAVAAALGVRLAALMPRPFAVAEAVRDAAGDRAAAVLAPLDRGGEFTVVRAGDVLFARTVSAAAFTTPQALAAELKRNLTVAASQAGAAGVAGLFVAESPDALGALADRLEGLVAGPVEPFDPLAGLSGTDAVPAGQRGRFAGAVGAALGRARHAVLPVNFAEPRQPRADPGPNRARLLVGAALALLAVAGLALWGYAELDAADGRIADLRARAKELDADKERLDVDAARLTAIDQFEGRGTVILDALYDMAVRDPDVGKVRVTEVDVQPVALPKVKPGEKVPRTPAATVTVVAQTGDDKLSQQLAERFANAFPGPFATGFVPKKIGNPGGKGSTYRLTGSMFRMLPTDYVRKIVPPKPAATEDPDGDPDDPDTTAGPPEGENP